MRALATSSDTYAPELLPGVAEALEAGDQPRVRQQLQVLAEAVGARRLR